MTGILPNLGTADTIGLSAPDACPIFIKEVSKPTPLCGSFGELPTWTRGTFKVTYRKCLGKPQKIVRQDFIKCSDST